MLYVHTHLSQIGTRFSTKWGRGVLGPRIPHIRSLPFIIRGFFWPARVHRDPTANFPLYNSKAAVLALALQKQGLKELASEASAANAARPVSAESFKSLGEMCGSKFWKYVGVQV